MNEADLAPAVDAEGPAAPPRANGELVFESPWEGRAFGLVMNLCERGLFDYEDFRAELIRAIGEAEQSGEAFRYYDCWLLALERLLVTRGLLQATTLEGLVAEYAARPHGHDHHHEHEHDRGSSTA
jgi:nitrile hydratase accessory protein